MMRIENALCHRTSSGPCAVKSLHRFLIGTPSDVIGQLPVALTITGDLVLDGIFVSFHNLMTAVLSFVLSHAFVENIFFSPSERFLHHNIPTERDCRGTTFFSNGKIGQMPRSISVGPNNSSTQNILSYVEANMDLHNSHLDDQQNKNNNKNILHCSCSEPRWEQCLNASSLWQPQVDVIDQILSCFCIYKTCHWRHD